MATTTTRLGLRKPVDDDGLDVTSDIAGNMQLIDDQVALADDLLNLAGAGRTTETVKGANDTAVAAQTAINNHAARTDNPHNVTAAQIGALAASTLGQPNGPAKLDAVGALAIAPTWNNAGTTFTALKVNVTDTASAGASLLADLQVGGASKFSVDKAGALTAAGDVTLGGAVLLPNGAKIHSSAGGLNLNYNTGSNQSLNWYGGGTSAVFSVSNTGSATLAGTLNVKSGLLFADAGNNKVGINTGTPAVTLDVAGTIQASTQINVKDANAVLNRSGNDFNIQAFGGNNLLLQTTGAVVVGSGPLTQGATTGFLYIPTITAVPTGVPVAFPGRVPIVFDTANNKLWVYNGAWKGAGVV